MDEWLRLIDDMVPSIQLQHERDEAYLAEAEDVCDLERRMRRIDARGRDADTPFALGPGESVQGGLIVRPSAKRAKRTARGPCTGSPSGHGQPPNCVRS